MGSISVKVPYMHVYPLQLLVEVLPSTPMTYAMIPEGGKPPTKLTALQDRTVLR